MQSDQVTVVVGELHARAGDVTWPQSTPVPAACGELTETSQADRELLKAPVRTQAGRRSVPKKKMAKDFRLGGGVT